MPALSILVADDEPDLRDLVQLTLEQEGHQVTVTPDGKKAAQALAKGKFDLLVTDVLMPDGDGIELISDVRTKYPAMKVVVMTSGGQISRREYLTMAKHLGADVGLEKPFNRNQLLAAVKTALATA
ncbi:MAG TPA: response regulator [Opitutaceae bacterium]|nr:response regulator [Opitutaceae bacterium]